MKRTPLLLLLLFSIITGFSQIKVTGTLVDSVTHQPIQYSRITFGESNYQLPPFVYNSNSSPKIAGEYDPQKIIKRKGNRRFLRTQSSMIISLFIKNPSLNGENTYIDTLNYYIIDPSKNGFPFRVQVYEAIPNSDGTISHGKIPCTTLSGLVSKSNQDIRNKALHILYSKRSKKKPSQWTAFGNMLPGYNKDFKIFGDQCNFGFLNTGNPLIYINYSVE